MNDLLIVAISGVSAFAIAHFIGKKRQIGFGWSFFFSLTLSPIFGLIFTLSSRKYTAPNPPPSKSKKSWGWLLVALASILFLGELKDIADGYPFIRPSSILYQTVGLIALGFYIIQLGKGKNFNPKGRL